MLKKPQFLCHFADASVVFIHFLSILTMNDCERPYTESKGHGEFTWISMRRIVLLMLRMLKMNANIRSN